jgi:hypothetical protein
MMVEVEQRERLYVYQTRFRQKSSEICLGEIEVFKAEFTCLLRVMILQLLTAE